MSGTRNDDDVPPRRPPDEDVSLTAWVLVGSILVFAYILVLTLLHPTP